MYHKLTYESLCSSINEDVGITIYDSLAIYRDHSYFSIKMDSTSTLILPFNCLVGIEQPTNAEGRLYDDDIPLSYWNSYDSVHYIAAGSDGLGYLRWFVEAGSCIRSSISQNVKILPIINNTNDDYVAHFRFSFNEIASGYAFSQMSDYVSSLPVKVFEPLSSTIVPDSFEYPVGAVVL